jgi:hypothetical protein
MGIDLRAIETKTFRRSWRGFKRDDVRGYLLEVAEAVRDDDHFRRAGVEVASALRRMHELVSATRDQAVHDADALRRNAMVDAEAVLAESRGRAERIVAEAENQAGIVRFEAAVWAMNTRARAEADRATIEEGVEEARAAIDRMEGELAERARSLVEEELERRRAHLDRLSHRIRELKDQEADVVARLHKVEDEVGALVRGPMADVVFVDVPLGENQPDDHEPSDDDGDAVVLDLTGNPLDAALQAGLRQALSGTED